MLFETIFMIVIFINWKYLYIIGNILCTYLGDKNVIIKCKWYKY